MFRKQSEPNPKSRPYSRRQAGCLFVLVQIIQSFTIRTVSDHRIFAAGLGLAKQPRQGGAPMADQLRRPSLRCRGLAILQSSDQLVDTARCDLGGLRSGSQRTDRVQRSQLRDAFRDLFPENQHDVSVRSGEARSEDAISGFERPIRRLFVPMTSRL